jgi:hypothetical protein
MAVSLLKPPFGGLRSETAVLEVKRPKNLTAIYVRM